LFNQLNQQENLAGGTMNYRYSVGLLAGIMLHLSLASATVAQMPMNQAEPSSAASNQFQQIEQPIALKAGVVIGGLGLIGLELWWFIWSKPRTSTKPRLESRD
jgi:plastocyanin domain-containing protein